MPLVKSAKPQIAIVNSSSFGVSFPEHLATLETFADICRIEIPKGADASYFHEKLREMDGIIASVTPIYTKEVLAGLPKLRLLARHGVGCDNVDLIAASSLGIGVSRVGPLVECESVAQMAVGLMNDAARQISFGASLVKSGNWAKRAQIPLGVDFNGATIGLIGIGAIGSTVSRILSLGFGAKVIACDPYLDAETINKRHAKKVGFEELLTDASIISLHCPLTKETARMLGSAQFAAMKKGAILVNTCRGELLHQSELINVLNSGQLAGYASDVVEGEPIDETHILLKTPNVIITPHLGGYSLVSLFGMGKTMVDDMQNLFTRGVFPPVLANTDLDLTNSRMAKMGQSINSK